MAGQLTKDKPKVGRPKRVFSEEEKSQIEQMALDNCHMDTIALSLDIPKETLVDNFRTFICQKRAFGRTELRAAQRVKALIDRDTAMLCFLGKNELGQADKKEVIIRDDRYTDEQRDAIRAELAGKCVVKVLEGTEPVVMPIIDVETVKVQEQAERG